MGHIEAVYRNGVFEPVGPVDLREGQRVRLSIDPATGQPPQWWLNQIRELQAGVVRRSGFLPDSAREIAADRIR